MNHDVTTDGSTSNPQGAGADIDYGVNVIGFVSGSLGQGVVARNTVRALDGAGVPLKVVDVDPGFGRLGHDTSVSGLGIQSDDPNPLLINLFHVNAEELAWVVRTMPDLEVAQRMNVIAPFWELPILPEAWLPSLRAIDLVLAPSIFIRDAVRHSFPDKVCLHYPQAVSLPSDTAGARPRWGLPDDAVVFSTMFDVASDIDRKNPLGVIQAFKEAFSEETGRLLLIKVTATPGFDGVRQSNLESLRLATGGRSDIRIMDEMMSYTDVLSLWASSDVFVSLHRGEGLGLGLMEAMALGKPVVATAWSGNMDFTNDTNACLVPYRLVPVESHHPRAYGQSLFPENAKWAEADLSEAAEWLRRLDADPALRKRLGETAAKDMADRLAAYSKAEVFQEVRRLAEDRDSEPWRQRELRGWDLTAFRLDGWHF